MSSATGMWTKVEQHGPTVDITDARNKLNDLQEQAARLEYSSHPGSRKRYNDLRAQIARQMEHLAKAYEDMATHLKFNADQTRNTIYNEQLAGRHKPELT